ncbi:hypothetical protein AVEN_208736-1, partial [Araneus ventricosus]
LKKREGSWDGRCHFEPWSDDKDGTLAGILSKLPHHTSGGDIRHGGSSGESGFQPGALRPPN